MWKTESRCWSCPVHALQGREPHSDGPTFIRTFILTAVSDAILQSELFWTANVSQCTLLALCWSDSCVTAMAQPSRHLRGKELELAVLPHLQHSRNFKHIMKMLPLLWMVEPCKKRVEPWQWFLACGQVLLSDCRYKEFCPKHPADKTKIEPIRDVLAFCLHRGIDVNGIPHGRASFKYNTLQVTASSTRSINEADFVVVTPIIKRARSSARKDKELCPKCPCIDLMIL